MFTQRLTEESMQIMLLALSLTKRLGHKSCEREHVFLSILGLKSCKTGEFLRSLGFDFRAARKALEQTNPGNSNGKSLSVASEELEFSAECKGLVEDAAIEAAKDKTDFVSTKHLLFAMLSATESPALIAILATAQTSQTQLMEALTQNNDQLR